MNTQRYTTLAAGSGARLMRHSSETSEVVTTFVDRDRARRVAELLALEADRGASLLVRDAELAARQASGSRRRMLTAFDRSEPSTDDALLSVPDAAERYHAASFGDRLGAAVYGEPPTVVRAIRDEAASLYDGFDDVLVVAEAAPAYRRGRPAGRIVINQFLLEATAEQLEFIATRGAGGDAGTWFDLIDVYSDELAEAIDGEEWDTIDMTVDGPALANWLRHRRPELAELAEAADVTAED